MKNRVLMALCGLLAAFGAQAQIGYQVAIMDQAKGTPKANEPVSVTVTITDNAGTTICSETQSGTTDEFGILSMQIGSASTFSNVNWKNLPLWVSAKVGDVTISKTQILSVPVAEYAKQTGQLTKEILKSKTWKSKSEFWGGEEYYGTLKFTDNTMTESYTNDAEEYFTNYYISGNTVICTSSKNGTAVFYNPETNSLVCGSLTYR